MSKKYLHTGEFNEKYMAACNFELDKTQNVPYQLRTSAAVYFKKRKYTSELLWGQKLRK